MKRAQCSYKKLGIDQRGFTLLEAMIAALVLGVGMIGLAALQGVSLKMNQGAYLRLQAVNLAYEIVDSIRANRNQVTSYVGEYATITCNPSLSYNWTTDIAASDIAIWRNRLACLLPSGSGEIENDTPAAGQIQVTVTWDETRYSADGTATTQSFQFVTAL